MIVTSVIVLAIVGSAFAFNGKKIGKFCTSVDLSSQMCNALLFNSKRGGMIRTAYYVVDWDGNVCNGQTCTTSANFIDN